jgi:hypothetical protein
MPRSSPPHRRLLAATLAGVAGLGAACKQDRFTPTECTVWTEKDGQVTGTVYLQDKRGSFTAGGARQDVAYMDAADHVMVLVGPKAVDAATFDGQTIRITYLPDATFTSLGFDNGTVVIASDLYRTEFHYNSLCTARDVAVGAVTLFTVIFPISQPATL